MKTSKIFVPREVFHQVNQALRASGVKFYPFQKTHNGYNIQFEPQDHPLVSYLCLKYDVDSKND